MYNTFKVWTMSFGLSLKLIGIILRPYEKPCLRANLNFRDNLSMKKTHALCDRWIMSRREINVLYASTHRRFSTELYIDRNFFYLHLLTPFFRTAHIISIWVVPVSVFEEGSKKRFITGFLIIGPMRCEIENLYIKLKILLVRRKESLHLTLVNESFARCMHMYLKTLHDLRLNIKFEWLAMKDFI